MHRALRWVLGTLSYVSSVHWLFIIGVVSPTTVLLRMAAELPTGWLIVAGFECATGGGRWLSSMRTGLGDEADRRLDHLGTGDQKEVVVVGAGDDHQLFGVGRRLEDGSALVERHD